MWGTELSALTSPLQILRLVLPYPVLDAHDSESKRCQMFL